MQDTDRDLLPEGLEDRLPRDAAAAARVTRAVLDVLDSHGYDRVQPPTIEFEKSMASRMAGSSRAGCSALSIRHPCAPWRCAAT